jgi:hypothetical protein
MDIFSFFSGFTLSSDPVRPGAAAPLATHEAPSIAGYVEDLSQPPSALSRLVGGRPTPRDCSFGVIVNFGLHVMRHDQRAVLFGGSSHAIECALDRNEEKTAVVAVEIKLLRRWLRTIVSPRGRLRALFDNHQLVRWGVQKSFDLRGEIGLVAIGDVDEPSIWAFHLAQNRSKLAPDALLVAAGEADRIDAFARHVQDFMPNARLEIRRFRGQPTWAICLGQPGFEA